MSHSMLRGLKNYILSRKMKDFIDCGGLHMLYKPVIRSSKYIFLLC